MGAVFDADRGSLVLLDSSPVECLLSEEDWGLDLSHLADAEVEDHGEH